MATISPPIQNAVSIDPGYLRAKRILDILFTLLMLFPLCIMMVIVAVLIRLDSKGPIFFRQKRVGLIGAEFNLFKFRSMYVNCDDSAHREAIRRYMNGATLTDDVGTDNPYKLTNDPRVTRVGRFIRRTSIDELPQFINVLRGEMTLVGPRPPLAYEVEAYSLHDLLRLCGKPGLTGSWQVYGRSQATFQEMVEMDIAYLQQQSIWQDLKLIALTVPVMLQGRGGV
jgi:lipopolysaccharide/colanic/teichoic acid biosynthesis glycosyltransferase